MASIHQLLQEDTVICDLLAWPYFLINASAAGPELRTAKEDISFKDGQRILYARLNNVVEQYVVVVAGDTQADVDTNYSKLEKLATLVTERVNDFGDKVWLKSQPDGTTYAYRTLVMAMTIAEEGNRLEHVREFLSATGYGGKKFTMCRVLIERTYFWECTTELSIPLTNGNGTNVTTGLTVRNHDDSGSGDDNFATISSSDVAGNLPAPLKLKIQNQNASYTVNDIWVANNAHFTPTSFQHWYEAEAASRLNGEVTLVTNAGYSGGASNNGVRIAHSGGSDYSDLAWTITGTQLSYMRGRWFHILGRFGLDGPCYVRVSICSETGTAEYQLTWWVRHASAGFTDLGALKFPPFDMGSTVTPADMILRLYTNYTTSYTVDLDAIMLVPASETDGLVYMPRTGIALAQNNYLIHDGPNQLVYSVGSGETTGGLPSHSLIGGYLNAHPGVSQRLLLAWDGPSDGISPISHEVKVWALYRPRRMRL